MKEEFKLLESQIREIYGRVVYTHKTHEKCADILKRRNNYFKHLEIILSAITTTTILGVIFGEGRIFEAVAALTSTLTLALTLYTKEFNLLSIAERHKSTALEILEIRENLLSLLVDIRIGNKNIENLQSCRDKLLQNLNNAYKGAPQTINEAYQTASKALKENEEFTFSDEEIDMFLPKDLNKEK